MPATVFHTYRDRPWPDPDSFRAVISLGCPHPANRYHEAGWLRNLHQLVEKTVKLELPYLGICFGGQILALVLGADVAPNHKREIGTYRVRLTEAGTTDPLLDGFPPAFKVFHWHNDTFGIPVGAYRLVEGDDCPNQAFRYGRAAALQFHLEVMTDEIPVWCRSYPDELASTNLTAKDLTTAWAVTAETARTLHFRLLDNFFRL
ncbi:MAG: type 1 glutamine amidotransferase [Candidatus Zixiibacteriota bacterium]|nr:MAG: type 1 glutamine amidotransferase [candidate division Zixibacteria bacterium]